ncbi:ATP-binding protein [Nocardia vaccinii]|uniref:ATP-binding protein n=1 Tax=Nocardia vaccinii TaxID=1822 RepID=UPI00082C3083|nr:ATP-binding protein [Nocardia vaccinii]
MTVTNLRRTPSLELNFAAVPDRLGQVRGAVRSWLVRISMDESRIADLLLAVDEACTNAVEHGHRGDGGPVSLTGRVEGDRLHIVVADHGRWKPQDPEPDQMRGRGMAIIRAVVPDVEIRTGDTGTVVEMRVRIPERGGREGSARFGA